MKIMSVLLSVRRSVSDCDLLSSPKLLEILRDKIDMGDFPSYSSGNSDVQLY
jgi:hypothetical protein